MSFPIYPSYIGSGSEWIGLIPCGWKMAPVRTVATCNDDVLDEKTPPDRSLDYVEIGDVSAVGGVLGMTTMAFKAAPSRARRLVQHGDVIVSTVRTYLRAIAPIRQPPETMVVSTGFAVFRPRNVDPNFLSYVFQAEFMISEVISRSVGVSYPAINARDIGKISIPLPDPAEQAAIAAFLDRETDKIDAGVHEQERLIALLEEKKRALILLAVTKGLDADAPQVDSGIAWIGSMPVGWRSEKLKRVSPEITVGVVVMPSQYYVDDGVIALRSFNVQPMTVNPRDPVYFSPDTNDQLKKSKLNSGDLVAVRTGNPGTTAVVSEELDGVNCIDLIIIRKSEQFDSRFLAYVMNSDVCRIQYEMGSEGALHKHFNVETAANLRFVCPDVDVQVAIVAYLDAEVGKHDSLILEAKMTTALLVERRKALISAAVTGKIDLRASVEIAPIAQAAE